MTINGPAPMILAMFMNTAIDQRVERHLRDAAAGARSRAALAREPAPARPRYRGELPAGPRRLGAGPARHERPDSSSSGVLTADEYARLRAEALSRVRGTVQADILKEDQAQNTCIFSTEFALRMMGDVQAFFSDNDVRNFYSVSISGYHIAEAGANPMSQLAFTLANGFTIVEYYLARGMKIDDFAPNLSFFFSNGMDAEYAVIGRVARRIWARAMRDLYQAGPRSQMLKYHIQTSGRSLHAREIQFNDIRTTLQAMYALFDNCNSLHTNAYDEALTTPTEESVRRAVAIQLIINRELGLNKIQNPWAGLVRHRGADRSGRGGRVQGVRVARRTRRRARRDGDHVPARQDPGREPALRDSKHDGSLPIVGVNTFLKRARRGEHAAAPLFRATEDEQRAQVDGVREFQARHAAEARRSAAPAAGGGRERRQRIRRVAGDRAGLLARPDLARALRSRRPVPPAHVSCSHRRSRGLPG